MFGSAMRSFLDTNVLVYADAGDEPVKQTAAIALISRLRREGTGVISTQVLQEFANVALRKLRLPPALVRERLHHGAPQQFPVQPTTIVSKYNRSQRNDLEKISISDW